MKVYKNIKEAVNEMFFKEVLGLPKPIKIKKTTKLSDFCQNKEFSDEMVDMYVDRAERTFRVSIRKMKDKPIVDLLSYIESKKKKHSIYG